MACVIPLYKKGSKLEHGNYRPVSILSTLSKIVENIVGEQIDAYVSTNNLLFDFQSGFRRSHSTDTCLLFLTDHIRKEVDSGRFYGPVMLDLQKAFDTVDYVILLSKLKAFWLRWPGPCLRTDGPPGARCSRRRRQSRSRP